MRNGDTARGLDDNAWTNMAGGMAGFTVEPDAKKWKRNHNGEEYHDIKDRDAQAVWRIDQFRNSMEPEERRKSFLIDKVEDDGKTAIPASGKDKYPVREDVKSVDDGCGNQRQVKDYTVQVFGAK